MTPIENAILIRQRLDSITSEMSDDEAIKNAVLFKQWNGNGIEYKTNERVVFNGTLYSVLIAHISQPNWCPDVSPSLFAKVLNPDPEVIPEWEQPDSTNPYMKGDKVRYNGKIYESLIDNNIWSPSDYPNGWKEIIK